MSDLPLGPGWWQASDLRWYSPEQLPLAARPKTSNRRTAVVLAASLGLIMAVFVGWQALGPGPSTTTTASNASDASPLVDDALTIDAALAGKRVSAGLADRIRIALPIGWEIVSTTPEGSPTYEDCPVRHGTISSTRTRPPVWIDITMTSAHAGCAVKPTRPLNGDHGSYTRIQDVPDPQDVTSTTSAAGVVTTFTQVYRECMNECRDSTDAVALVELANPPDENFPTVMLRADADAITPAQLSLLGSGITTLGR